MNATVAGTFAHAQDALYRRVTWRLLPFLLVCYLVAYLDRVNVGFAKLQMLHDLQFSDAMYGFGAGIFFAGYFIFEVPSNLILRRVGARIWIARIMISWGVISAATMFARTPEMFYVMRFVLGAAEAGFFPGVILYISYWYPAHRRGRVTTLFLAAVALSGVIGSPISGLIMKYLDGASGLTGWQWLFLLEGLPSIALGVLVLSVLPARIADVTWLSAEERAHLAQAIAREDATRVEMPLLATLANGRVWHLSLIYFAFVMPLYGISFWLPTMINALGVKDKFDIGIISAIPWTCAVVAMLLAAAHSDRSGERRWHIALAGVAGAVGLALSVVLHDNAALSIAALTLATMGIMTTLPLFWSLPTGFLGGVSAAAGIALINSLGNLAGYLAPTLVGAIQGATHSTDLAMYLLAAIMVAGAVLTIAVPARLAKNPL